ncbi:MAG: aconitase family protein [Hyphomicrobiales bacterium]|nr:aconitase family protein [Hyphomicrobiales bacterium]
MPAQTTVQKIIARAAGRPHVDVGAYVDVRPDYVCFQELYWPIHKANLARIGATRVVAPDRIVMVIDHTTARAMGSIHHETHHDLERFTREHGIRNFFKAGTGLRHLVLTENGFARPGTLIFSDEGNIASIGAVGALNIPISTEVFVGLVRDTNWVQVPETVRIRLDGQLPRGSTARDLIQRILADMTRSGALLQACVEFHGPGTGGLTLDDRQTVLASLFHSGAYTGLMEMDDRAWTYVRERAAGPVFDDRSDPDAEIRSEFAYDLSGIEPMVTPPPEMDAAVPVSEVAGRRIDQATIGSCANNRLDDMRAAAWVLRGRRVAPHVALYVTPGSRSIYAEAAKEGLLTVFAEAGATVLAPGCTTCWGYQGVLSAGERLISTQQFNYHGRNGSREAEVYLAGPAVVAASAVAGEICNPLSLDAPVSEGAA